MTKCLENGLDKIFPTVSIPGVLHRSFKAHKFRPILSAIGVPNFHPIFNNKLRF